MREASKGTLMAGRFDTRISRRALLRGGAAGASALAATALVGCGGGSGKIDATARVSPTASAATRPAAAPTAVPAKSAWSRVPSGPGPAARRDHSLTFNPDDGLIYLFGGRAKGVADNQLWTFDPKAATWQQINPDGAAPEPRFAQDASYDVATKRLVVALGQGNGGAFFNDVWAFGGGRWTRLDAGSAERPEIRYGAGGAYDAAGDRILISHGFTDRGRFDDSWTFDLTAGRWAKIATSGAVPIKRCLARCLWQPGSGSLLMFGGQTDDNPFLGDFWALDVANGAWAEPTPAPLPGPRNLYGASLGEGGKRWYVVGGNTADGPTAEMWAYDLALATWSRIEPAGDVPPARYSTDAAFAAGKLYIFGGHDGNGEIDDMWALAPAS
jgi:hypothetical protein